MRRPHVRVRFPQHRVPQGSPATGTTSELLGTTDGEIDVAAMEFPSSVPSCFLQNPSIQDDLVTTSSKVQQETINECLPLLGASQSASRSHFDFNEYGIPALERDDHISFLNENLAEFPAPFVGLDASRPWMVYWGLLGLHLLGEEVVSFQSRVRSTFYPLQNPDGGFGGGHGHYSHLAATYAALLSIALVGGEENYAMIDRTAMWHWLGELKQPNGGFQICAGGEVDTRGAYCALVVISLLSLPTELPPNSPARRAGLHSFNDGLCEWLSRCQNYEGGIAGGPGNEAHGAYAFCAIACLCLLGPPASTIQKSLNVEALISWLSSRQYAPEGGFAGRTNKLVDGCYSHWIGGCWPLIQGALNGVLNVAQGTITPEIGNLYSREGLARYILCCCQGPEGGLRDKPSKRPDSYHTCYTLTGISMTEHFHFYTSDNLTDQFASAFAWDVVKVEMLRDTDAAFSDGTEIRPLHPVYVIPHSSVMAIREWCQNREL